MPERTDSKPGSDTVGSLWRIIKYISSDSSADSLGWIPSMHPIQYHYQFHCFSEAVDWFPLSVCQDLAGYSHLRIYWQASVWTWFRADSKRRSRQRIPNEGMKTKRDYVRWLIIKFSITKSALWVSWLGWRAFRIRHHRWVPASMFPLLNPSHLTMSSRTPSQDLVNQPPPWSKEASDLLKSSASLLVLHARVS